MFYNYFDLKNMEGVTITMGLKMKLAAFALFVLATLGMALPAAACCGG